MSNRPTIAYLIEPRFPGGTSAAVARELPLAREFGQLSVVCLSTKMFRDRKIAPVLEAAFADLGIRPVWDPAEIGADLVILHNPSMLKFQSALPMRILARELVVVTQENLLRPTGIESFDVAKCLDQIDKASVALKKTLAPISPWNRKTISEWGLASGGLGGWSVLEKDWLNICEFDVLPPTKQPADRRGRLSRPGFEKFPPLEVMDACFPVHAEANVILGADTLIAADIRRPNWTLLPFRGIEADEFFQKIDFMVYFTSPVLRESFGRVLAEGIAAGKVVISDPETAKFFDGAVLGARPEEVDDIVATFLAEPESYRRFVLDAQAQLVRFSARAFCDVLGARVGAVREQAA